MYKVDIHSQELGNGTKCPIICGPVPEFPWTFSIISSKGTLSHRDIVKVYKAISDNLENHKIVNCIVFCNLLNFLTCIIISGCVLCMREIFNVQIRM